MTQTGLLFASKSSTFRELLLVYQALVPFLYTENQASPSLEHVVPQRVLRHARLGKDALRDPYNLFLTSKHANSRRSDYPFLLPTPVDLSRICSHPVFPKEFTRVGHGSYVSHKRRLFIPRFTDYGVIARCVLRCNKTYGIDCEEVVYGGKKVASRWALLSPVTKAEKVHNILAQYWEFASKGIIRKEGWWYH